ncbi:MAG: chaperone NapD [Sutterellaceae bacterium]|nr:chaperone NapD [Sutterellaceae bacterium]
MFYSGLLVTCAPENFESIKNELKVLPGVEIHQTDKATGRFVVVLEEETIEAETDRFAQIRKLEGVVDVSLVVHRQDDTP